MNKYKSSFNGTGRAHIGNIRNNVKQCQTYKVIVTIDKDSPSFMSVMRVRENQEKN